MIWCDRDDTLVLYCCMDGIPCLESSRPCRSCACEYNLIIQLISNKIIIVCLTCAQKVMHCSFYVGACWDVLKWILSLRNLIKIVMGSSLLFFGVLYNVLNQWHFSISDIIYHFGSCEIFKFFCINSFIFFKTDFALTFQNSNWNERLTQELATGELLHFSFSFFSCFNFLVVKSVGKCEYGGGLASC